MLFRSKKNTELFEEEIQEKMKSGDHPLEFPGLKFTVTADESKALNESNESSIIISASGMCEVGRIKHHLKHNLWNPKSTILFVGYQAPGTLGRSIVDGAEKVKIFGEEIAVNARIEYIEGYSGHADQEWLLNFIYSFINKPKHVFLVHGEEEGQLVLKQKIEETAEVPVTIPDFGEAYELTSDGITELEKTEEVKRFNQEFVKLDVLDRIEKMKDSIDDLENVVVDTEYDEIKALSDRIKEIETQILNMLTKK